MLPESARRQRLAFQTLRLLPRASLRCERVELGGRATGRLQGVELRPEASQQLLRVIEEAQPATPFAMTGNVRMVDLDLALIRVKPPDARPVDVWITADVAIDSLAARDVSLTGRTVRDAAGRETKLADVVEVLDVDEAVAEEE
jgi:hypothetical protein